LLIRCAFFKKGEQSLLKHHDIEEVIILFLEHLDLNPNTIENYQSILNQYIAYLKRNNIKKPRRKDILNYRLYLFKSGQSETTIQKYMVVLKKFYKWARIYKDMYHLDDAYKYDIAEGVKGAIVEQMYKKEPLSLKQVQALLEVTNNHNGDIIDLRNQTIILLMLITGMRTVEVARAKRSDISKLNGKWILYVQGKGKIAKNHFVKLPGVLIEAIQDYLYLRVDQNPYLFIKHQVTSDHQGLTKAYIGRMINKYFKKAGIDNPKITPHSLRHTAAYINLSNGGTLEATRQLLRHKHIESTLIYAHQIERINDDSEERIANQYFKKEEPHG